MKGIVDLLEITQLSQAESNHCSLPALTGMVPLPQSYKRTQSVPTGFYTLGPMGSSISSLQRKKELLRCGLLSAELMSRKGVKMTQGSETVPHEALSY